MPYTVDADGKPVWVETTPDRTTPAAKPPGDGSTIVPELEQHLPGAPAERTVQLVDPGGGIYDVAESGVATALQSGRFKLASPAEVQRWDTRKDREGAIESLKAFGEGAGAAVLDVVAGTGNLLEAIKGEKQAEALKKRGLVTGREIQGKLLTGFDEEERKEYDERARLRAEEHGLASGAGNLAGTALTAAIPGGIASKAGAALGAGRTLASGLAGLAEGAAIGYSGASEEAYFENRELTGEQVLAGMGWGALIGGGLGLGAGKAQDLLFSRTGSRGATAFDSPRAPATAARLEAREAVEAGASAVGATPTAEGFGERFADKLRGYSEERVAKAIGARGSDLKKLGRTAPAAEAELRRMARDVLEGTLEDGTPIFKAVQSQDELVGNLVRAREEAGAALGAFRERVSAFIDGKAPDLRPKPAAIADRIEKEVLAPLQRSKLTASEAGKVQTTVDDLRALGDDVSIPDLRQYQDIVKKRVYPQKVGPGLPSLPPEGAVELQKVERIIEENITASTDKAAAKMGGGELNKYSELKAKYRSYREAAQIAGNADLRELSNRVVSPSDYLTGLGGSGVGAVLGGGPVGSAVAGAATAAIHKTIREHSSAVLAVLADRLAKTVDRRVTRSLDGFFERALGTAARTLPANDTAPAVARRVSASTGKPVAAAAAMAAPLALFMGKETDAQAAYRKRAKEILDANAEYGTRVRARVEETLGELAPQAPKLAASMTTTATRGAQFLASKLPAPTVNARSFTPSKPMPVSSVDIDKFAKYWAAVSNPMSVLESLKVGRLTPEQVEALQVVYPELYQSVRIKVVERLGELDRKGTFIPYRSRLELDMLLGLAGAGEPTVSPQMVQLFQQIRATAPSPEEQERPTPPAKPVNIASHLRSGRDAIDPGAQQ